MCIGPVVRIEPAEEREEGGRFHRALKKLRAQPRDEYIDCSFILATAVGVERLWSLAKNVLTDRRRGMATLMVQVILFLKENRELWNDEMVFQSIAKVKKNDVNDRRRKREELLAAQDIMQAAMEDANTL